MTSDPAGPDSSNDPSPHSRPPIDARAAAVPPPPPPPGYMPPAYAPPPKQRGLLTKLATSLVASLLIFSLITNVYLAFLVYSLTAGGEGVYREGNGEQAGRVAIVPIEGGIDDDMVKFVKTAFKGFEKETPSAVVLRINSGGGGVTASDQIWHTIHQFKAENPKVAVVASFGGIAASGGYYIAAPADYIYIEQTGITGSIGVIAQIPSLAGTIDKLGIEMNTVVADGSGNKAIANNLFENWKDENGSLTPAGEKNQAVLKNLLNSAHNRFVDVVDQGRPSLDLGEVQSLATGDIFTAQEAVEAKLVDETGYLDQAIDKAIELAGLGPDADPKVTVVRERQSGLLGLLGAQRGQVTLDLKSFSPGEVRTWLNDFSQVQLAYRYTLR
jgi:protease-4